MSEANGCTFSEKLNCKYDTRQTHQNMFSNKMLVKKNQHKSTTLIQALTTGAKL